MGSHTSRTLSCEGIDPAGAPASPAPSLCCSTASDVASKRGEQAELTRLRRSTQQHKNNGLRNAREHHLTRCKAAKDSQSGRALAAEQRSDLRQVRRDASELSTPARTVAHQLFHRRSAGHKNIPLAHEQRSRPGVREQRPRQRRTDSPYTAQGNASARRVPSSYFALLAIDTSHVSHGDGGWGGEPTAI
ncbi:hypothetical protein CUR178_03911 [Leishmania enriettii]|uniref:Uncharacterized protein n=1 Tax=Leishmania enriettii TaxID=5663 RepID=A0A836KKW5_LEIEN|nr:hypothetical protein CUR178_03911 [Leishmania enriettii]